MKPTNFSVVHYNVGMQSVVVCICVFTSPIPTASAEGPHCKDRIQQPEERGTIN